MDQSPLSNQVYYYGCPRDLLQGRSLKHDPNMKTKYSFVMGKEDFDNQIKPFFALVGKSSHREIVYDYDNEQYRLIEKGLWIKLVQHYDADNKTNEEVSIKLITTSSPSTIEQVRKRVIPLEKVKSETGEEFVRLRQILERCDGIVLDVSRERYQHKESDATLVVDRVLFENGETFIVLSFKGHYSFSESEMFKPCRSKIVEYLSRSNKTLYSKLVEQGKIDAKLQYESLSLNEFENETILSQVFNFGCNNERRREIEYEKQHYIELNKKLPEKEQYSEQYIKFICRSILVNGITYVEEDFDFD